MKGSKLRATCMYAVLYVSLASLAGNAIACGLYTMEAAGITGHDSAVRGIAIACLTLACILHALWRRGGIILNNILAIVKLGMLLAVIVIGFAVSAGATFGNGPVHGETINPHTHKAVSNFDVHTSFLHPKGDVANYANSLLFIVYSYSGYEQPFCQSTFFFLNTAIWTSFSQAMQT